MRARRLAAGLGIAIAAAVGAAGGWWLVGRSAGRPLMVQFPRAATAAERGWREREPSAPPAVPVAEALLRTGPEQSRSVDALTGRPDGWLPTPRHAWQETQRTETPGRLPEGDAAPLPPAPGDAAILEVIEEELPGASDLEREVWLEQLRDMPPVDMRQLLRLWRDRDRPAISTFPEPSAGADVPDVLDPPAPLAVGDYAELLAAGHAVLESAQHTALNNLLNSDTPGFKRSMVLVEERPYDYLSALEAGAGKDPRLAAFGTGAAACATRIDIRQGALIRTGRPLDLAIEGAGFFPVQSGEQIAYTRCGRLEWSADGRLVLRTNGGDHPLTPPIVVPHDALDVSVDADGTVRLTSEDGEETHVAGRIELARFLDPSALLPLGGGLYSPSAASGPPITGAPQSGGRGVVRQGHLEASNVDGAHELAMLRQLAQRLDTLEDLGRQRRPVAAVGRIAIVPKLPNDEGPSLRPLPTGISHSRTTGLSIPSASEPVEAPRPK
ncbi:MAG: flagellar hook basal-body protein [Planctomycetes bacterium]|nr:flagellar hook basal-body protein [Planctomycetota bacterium]